MVVLAASVKSYNLFATTLDHPEHMPQTIAGGLAHAPNQYRLLVPLLWKGASSAGLDGPKADVAIVVFGILFCYAALAAAIYLASRSVPVTALCLLAFYGAAASGFWFRTREFFFDVGFTASGMALVVQQRPAWALYVILSAVAALNRETWLFSLVAAAASRLADARSLRALLKDRRRDAVGLIASGLVSVAVLVAVRLIYGIRPYHTEIWRYDENIRLILMGGSVRDSFKNAIWFAGSGMFAAWAIFALAGAARHVPFVIAFAASLLVVSFVISSWYETRIFAPAYAVMLVSIAGGLRLQTKASSPP